MDLSACEKTCQIVAKYGPDVIQDLRRCEALLGDLCVGQKREVFALVGALKCKIPTELLMGSSGVPIDILLSRLSQRLQDEMGFTTENARWAVESWAVAVGRISMDQATTVLKQSTTEPSGEAVVVPAVPIEAVPMPPPATAEAVVVQKRSFVHLQYFLIAVLFFAWFFSQQKAGTTGAPDQVSTSGTGSNTGTGASAGGHPPAVSPTPQVTQAPVPSASIDPERPAGDNTVSVQFSEPTVPAQPSPVPTPAPSPEPVPLPAPTPDPRPLAFDRVLSLVVDPESNNYHGSLAPVGNLLIYSSARDGMDGGRYQPYIRDLSSAQNGSRLFSWNGNVWTPEFSPDAESFVFSSDSVRKEQIFVIERRTNKLLQLTSGLCKNMMPTFSPNGEKIAFVSDRNGSNDIWIMSRDGSRSVQVTSGSEDDREPRWWPDGRSIIFTRIFQKLKDSRIMRVCLDPLSPPEELVGGGFRNWMADVSPDSQYIAFTRSSDQDGGGNRIQVVRLRDGAGFTIDALNGAEEYRPIWTGNGENLVFHADQGRRKALFLARLKRVGNR